MRQAVKRSIYKAVTTGIVPLTEVGLKRERQGYWLCPQLQTRWELEVVFEPPYGDGVFRLEWGVRAARLAELIEREDIDHAMHATVGGDVGSLALRRSKMTMMGIRGGEISWMARWLWGVRAQSVDEVAARINQWVGGPLLDVLRPLTTYSAVADFLTTFRARFGQTLLYPEDVDLTVAGLRALEGKRAAAMAALDAWRASIPAVNQDVVASMYERVARRITEQTTTT